MQSIFQLPIGTIQELFTLLICYFGFVASAVYCLKPRFNKVITFLSTFILWELSLTHYHIPFDIPDIFYMLEFLVIVPWVIIMFKDKLLIKILFGFTIITMFTIGDTFEFALHYLIHQSRPDYSNISHCLITLLAIPTATLLVAVIWKKISNRNKTDKLTNNYNLIPILIIGEIFIALSFGILLSIVYDKLNFHYRVTVITISFFICSILIFIDIVAFYSIIKNNKYQKLKTQNEILEKTSAIQADYYNKIQENITETAKIRHDIYNLISVTNILIEENSQESKAEAKKNMQNIAEIMDKTKTKFYCDNKLINTVLYDKIGAAENKGITVDSRINIREEYKSIDNFDLCRIYINIIDNAINALDTYSGKKHFSISCDEKDNKLHIMCENPFDANTVTNKDDKNHGYGLNIVKDIAEKYNGNVILNNKDNIFRILVSLEISENN